MHQMHACMLQVSNLTQCQKVFKSSLMQLTNWLSPISTLSLNWGRSRKASQSINQKYCVKWFIDDIKYQCVKYAGPLPLLQPSFYSISNYCISVLSVEVVSFKKQDALRNLVLSSPLSHPFIWPYSHWWLDNQKTKERGSRGEEDSGPTTKIAQFSGWWWVSGRQSTGCQLFGKVECHS